MIPYQMHDEEIPVLRRPGTKSVRIVGPPQVLLKFGLNFKRHPKALDWNHLQNIDTRAEVLVQGLIDLKGNFSIEQLQDRGHPKAGLYIKRILDSWSFSPYKHGPIRYYFNVPSRMERMKMQIDVSGLSNNPRYMAANYRLKNGLLYHVKGISRKNIMVSN